MGRTLKYSVHVRKTEPVDKKRPELGENVVQQAFLVAGKDEVPDWATDLVPEHAYEDGPDYEAQAFRPLVSQADPTDADGDGRDDSNPDKPAGNASLEAWQEYAESQGFDHEGMGRDEIRDHFA